MINQFQPYARGDFFVAATLLDNSEDDHAGRGRILQYGADLSPKGVLWLSETTHLVSGLRFDAAGVLWAFDSHAFLVLNIYPDGSVLRRNEFGTRPYSHVNFAADGSLYLSEHLVGSQISPAVAARMKTLPRKMPGSDHYGDGHVWHYTREGRLLRECKTETHGGMGGFLGVTMSTLSLDGKILVYCSETGPRLMRFDLESQQQLPDLQAFAPPFPPGPPPMFFSMVYAKDGTLYTMRSNRIETVNAQGVTTRQIPLEGGGWSTILLCADGAHALVSCFFTGEIARIDLASGVKVGSIATDAPRAVAGIAEY